MMRRCLADGDREMIKRSDTEFIAEGCHGGPVLAQWATGRIM